MRTSAPSDHPPPHTRYGARGAQCRLRSICSLGFRVSVALAAHAMHGSVHPREVRVPHGPRVARDGVCK